MTLSGAIRTVTVLALVAVAVWAIIAITRETSRTGTTSTTPSTQNSTTPEKTVTNASATSTATITTTAQATAPTMQPDNTPTQSHATAPTHTKAPAPTTMTSPVQPPARAASTTPLYYTFNVPDILYEAPNAAQSPSPYWFLDSGAELIIKNGIGETIQGSLPKTNYWRELYDHNNPTDTDNGYHPQNIFRLVTKSVWNNATEEMHYRITADHFSTSPNRNESNGLLLMSRYQDHNTLYYSGIRVDGNAVIKKKYHGVYYTMAETSVYPGTYNHDTSPNLLPHNVWIGLRAKTTTLADGTVRIQLYLQRNPGTPWKLVLSARDKGSFGGTPPIVTPGIDGIRTDFMDVQFKGFSITPTT